MDIPLHSKLPHYMSQACLVYSPQNDTIYIMGCKNDPNCYEYDCKTTTYYKPIGVIPFSNNQELLGHKGCLIDNSNKILIIGTGESCDSHLVVYDIKKDEWISVPNGNMRLGTGFQLSKTSVVEDRFGFGKVEMNNLLIDCFGSLFKESLLQGSKDVVPIITEYILCPVWHITGGSFCLQSNYKLNETVFLKHLAEDEMNNSEEEIDYMEEDEIEDLEEDSAVKCCKKMIASRIEHGMVIEYDSGSVIVFGGRSCLHGKYNNDICKYDLKTDKWTIVQTSLTNNPNFLNFEFFYTTTNDNKYVIIIESETGNIWYMNMDLSNLCLVKCTHISLQNYKEERKNNRDFIGSIVITKNNKVHILGGNCHWVCEIQKIIPGYA